MHDTCVVPCLPCLGVGQHMPCMLSLVSHRQPWGLCIQSGTDCCCVYQRSSAQSATLVELCNSACEVRVICIWLTKPVWCGLILQPLLSRGFFRKQSTSHAIAVKRTVKKQCKHSKVATSPVPPFRFNLWSHLQALYDAASSGASPPPPSPRPHPLQVLLTCQTPPVPTIPPATTPWSGTRSWSICSFTISSGCCGPTNSLLVLGTPQNKLSYRHCPYISY